MYPNSKNGKIKQACVILMIIGFCLLHYGQEVRLNGSRLTEQATSWLCRNSEMMSNSLV